MKKGNGKAVVAMTATLVIMYVVPLPVYGTFQALGLVELPEDGTPGQFLLSVLVIKIGVAVAYVLFFRLASPALAGRWWPYAAIWWFMYAVIEVGQAIGPSYSAAEAIAGIISEAIYFPLATWLIVRILSGNPSAH